MGSYDCRRVLIDCRQLLAATAKVHGLTLVTRDITDIAATGVAYLNPFEPIPCIEHATQR